MPPRKGRRARQERLQEREAHLQVFKTPAAQTGSDAAYPDDEAEEPMDEGAMESSSDMVAPDDEDVITVAGAGSSPLTLQTYQQPTKQATDMGASQSREEDVAKNVRSAAQRLRGTNASASAGGVIKRGLVKPSPSARPTQSKKRKLPPKTRIQQAVYDAADSADTPLLRPTALPATTEFSPLRRQREAEQPPAPESGTSPRRSRRVQAQHGDATQQTTVTGAPYPEVPPPDHGPQYSKYLDYFPDPVVRQYVQAEPDAAEGANNDRDDNRIVNGNLLQDDEHATQHQQEPARKRGRPKKASNADKAHAPMQGHWTSHGSSERPTRLMEKKRRQHGHDASSRPDQQAPLRQQEAADAHAGTQANEDEEEASTQHRTRASTSHSTTKPDENEKTATATEPRRSARQQAALADMNRRRAAEEPPVDKPVVLRPSEVRFSDAQVEGSQSGSMAPEADEVSRPPTRNKRSVSPQPTQANTAAKRMRRAESEDDEYQESETHSSPPAGSQTLQRRLWSQWLPLQKIRRGLKEVGANQKDGKLRLQKEIALEDSDVKGVVGLCEEAAASYRNLKDGKADGNEPATLLDEISLQLDGLQGRDEDFPTDFHDKTKTTNIYFHLIPMLVKLLWLAIDCYESLDADDEPVGQISMGHLRIVSGIAVMILDMEEAARSKYKARPATADAVVRPVHNGIAVPLRVVAKAFQTVLQRHEADVRENERRQKEAEHRALRLEQEERRSRQVVKLAEIRKKWERLHLERWRAEGSFIRPAKGAHLRMPDPNLDVDANGNLFRRVSVFHPRVGPPPGLLHAAKSLVWTEGELWALTDGLRVYKGPMVYERLIRAWCPRGKMLNKYNVTEIVAAAESVKEWYVKEHGDDVDDWIKAIPVWSKSHAIGEENEDSSFADVDDIVGGADEDAPAAVSV